MWGLQSSFNPLATWQGQKDYCVVYEPVNGTDKGDPLAIWPECPAGKDCTPKAKDDGYACEAPSLRYVYSLYWALATVTSIGYGDVAATAFQPVEQLVCIVIM